MASLLMADETPCARDFDMIENAARAKLTMIEAMKIFCPSACKLSSRSHVGPTRLALPQFLTFYEPVAIKLLNLSQPSGAFDGGIFGS